MPSALSALRVFDPLACQGEEVVWLAEVPRLLDVAQNKMISGGWG